MSARIGKLNLFYKKRNFFLRFIEDLAIISCRGRLISSKIMDYNHLPLPVMDFYRQQKARSKTGFNKLYIFQLKGRSSLYQYGHLIVQHFRKSALYLVEAGCSVEAVL